MPHTRSTWNVVAETALAISVTVTLVACLFKPTVYPPFTDYDTATMAIFVNNLTYQSDHDFYFAESSFLQNQYRSQWATHFLPLSSPLSLIQRALGLTPQHSASLLVAAGMAMAAGGTCFFLLVIRQERQWSRCELLWAAAIITIAPCFFLYFRTGVVNIMASYFLFWAAIWYISKLAEDGRKRYFYCLAVSVSLYGLVVYPPIVIIPCVFLAQMWCAKTLRKRFLDRHLYGACALFLLLFVVAHLSLAYIHKIPLSHYLEEVRVFLDSRSEAYSLANLDPALIGEKLVKLSNQHFLFLHDNLGSSTRNDNIWTLGTLHLPWILIVFGAAIGILHGIRNADKTRILLSVILGIHYFIALTLSFPEGRYLLTAVPCYAGLFLIGLRAIVANACVRKLIMSALAVAMTAGTIRPIVTSYNQFWLDKQGNLAGIKEAIAHTCHLPEKGQTVFINVPLNTYQDFLYFQSLNNFRLIQMNDAAIAQAVSESQTAIPADGITAQYVVFRRADETLEISRWQDLGFSVQHRFGDPLTGESFVLLVQ